MSHSTSVPADISAPSEGMVKAPIGSASHHRQGGSDDPAGAGQRRFLQMPGIGDRHFGATDAGERGIDDETFRTFLRPFDLRVLEAMQGMVRIVHVHGTHVDIRRVLDYPCEAFSVSDRLPGNPSLAELRRVTDKCLMGGVNEARIPEYALPVLRAEMRDALRQAGKRKFLIAPGCTVASHTAQHILRCLRDTSRQLTEG